ncbi:MAG: hypothetical protein QOD93_2218, partial [Acetobacteraceae bacterium]|nr:hypothetical protein [Acetobacteraceae bacterium]
FFRACRFSCADAASTSPQWLPTNAASARKKHSPPDTAAAPTTYSPNSTSTPPTPHAKHPVNVGHQRFVGGSSAIDGCSYLGRPPDKIRWCSFPRPAMVLGRITEQWRASRRYRRTPHGFGLFRRLTRVPRHRWSATVSTSTAPRRAARAAIHRIGLKWALLTFRRRPVPPTAKIHTSVQQRIAQQPRYGKNRLPIGSWADPHWLT